MRDGYTEGAEAWLDSLANGPIPLEDAVLDAIDFVFDDPDGAEVQAGRAVLPDGTRIRSTPLVSNDATGRVYWTLTHSGPVIHGGYVQP